MFDSIKMRFVIFLAICIGCLSAQTDYDPETGLPIKPVAKVKYDPVTGAVLDDNAATTRIDPETGLPLRPATKAEPPELPVEKVSTAQPIAPRVVPVLRTNRSGRSSLTRLAQLNARKHNPSKSWYVPGGMANIAGMGLGGLTGALLGGALLDGLGVGVGLIGGTLGGSFVATASIGNTVKYAPVPEDIAKMPAAEIEVYRKAYMSEAKRLRMRAVWIGTFLVAGSTIGIMLLSVSVMLMMVGF